MPAALDIDREQVRMLAVSVGVREAARQMELPEATVQAWAARYGWIKNLPRSHPLPVTMVKLRATNATTAPEAQRNVIQGKLLETRENHLDGALAASREIKQMSGMQVLDNMDTVARRWLPPGRGCLAPANGLFALAAQHGTQRDSEPAKACAWSSLRMTMRPASQARAPSAGSHNIIQHSSCKIRFVDYQPLMYFAIRSIISVTNKTQSQ